jgi:hypothetical protein
MICAATESQKHHYPLTPQKPYLFPPSVVPTKMLRVADSGRAPETQPAFSKFRQKSKIGH